MGLFGKPKLTEAQAASLLVMAMLDVVRRTWPSVAEDLEWALGMTGQDASVLSDPFAPYELELAAMAMQMQSLKNVIGGSAAVRIREYIFQCLDSGDLGSAPSSAVAAYEDAWSGALRSGQAPHTALADLLGQRLGLETSMAMGNATYQDPILLTALAGAIASVGAVPWWKQLTSRYKIVR